MSAKRRNVKTLPSMEELHAWFKYDAERGVLVWKKGRHKATAGQDVAPKMKGYKYVTMGECGRLLVHRIIWAMSGRQLPKGYEIDHQDGNVQNNRIENLRLVTPQAQNMNLRIYKNNKSGHVGVWFDQRKKRWHAGIGFQGKYYHLGSHATKEAAIVARKAAEERFGFHRNHGRLAGSQ